MGQDQRRDPGFRNGSRALSGLIVGGKAEDGRRPGAKSWAGPRRLEGVATVAQAARQRWETMGGGALFAGRPDISALTYSQSPTVKGSAGWLQDFRLTLPRLGWHPTYARHG
ncbi:hypothetical protein BHM03_00042710 [Ensete ventricosum]|nr:hypothetical protein BHM03_00042710 [Ensete ventricosum]